MKLGFFDRFRHPGAGADPKAEQPVTVQIDAASLSRVFSAPVWVRDLGLLAWFLVGVALVIVGLIVLLGVTSTIVVPVTLGAILATVAGPVVTKLQRHRVPRAGGAAIVLLGFIALGVVIALLVFGGIYEQSDQIKSDLNAAVDKIQGWANDAGSGGTSGATSDAKSGVATTGKTFLHGIANGIAGLTSFVFFLTFTAFSTFFLLKDGPVVRRWIDRHMGVPVDLATTITSNVIQSLRRYFLGVTYVALFNGIIVGLGALALGVPLWGSIAVVTFALAYIPFIGAFIAGAFAVLVTLASQGTTDAVIMLVIVILANGLLQNIFQPIAFGATLDLNPLVVLIVTIGFGAIFGTIGMVLAAPLTAAAVHISGELARARAAQKASADDPTTAGPDVDFPPAVA